MSFSLPCHEHWAVKPQYKETGRERGRQRERGGEREVGWARVRRKRQTKAWHATPPSPVLLWRMLRFPCEEVERLRDYVSSPSDARDPWGLGAFSGVTPDWSFSFQFCKARGRVLNTHCNWEKSVQPVGPTPTPQLKWNPLGPVCILLGCLCVWSEIPEHEPHPHLIKYKNKTHCWARFKKKMALFLFPFCVRNHAGHWDWLHFEIRGTRRDDANGILGLFPLGIVQVAAKLCRVLGWHTNPSRKSGRGQQLLTQSRWTEAGWSPSDAWLRLVYYWALQGWFSFPKTCQHRSSSSPRLLHHTDCPCKQGANEVPTWLLWPEEHKVGYVFPQESQLCF